MNSGFLLSALALISVLTSLTVEALKKLLGDAKYSANLLAAIVSVILSIAVCLGYLIYTGTAFTAQVAVIIVAMTFLSFLSATCGYDKCVQLIRQVIGEK